LEWDGAEGGKGREGKVREREGRGRDNGFSMVLILYPLSIIHYSLSIIYYPLSIINYPFLFCFLLDFRNGRTDNGFQWCRYIIHHPLATRGFQSNRPPPISKFIGSSLSSKDYMTDMYRFFLQSTLSNFYMEIQ
jgi:hypothetical protein